MKKGILSLILCASLLVCSVAFADNDARDYLPAPPGTMLNILYYYNISGSSLNVNGSKVAKVDFSENLGLWREVYFFQLGPFVADVQLVVPFGAASLRIPPSGSSAAINTSGISDPIILGTVWLVNKPSCMTYLGFSPYFFIPVGSYDDSQTLNLGGNRWAFRDELVFTQGFEVRPNHNLYFEVTAGGDFFTENTDYFNGTTSGSRLSEDPIFNLESHVSYDLTKSFWISADYYGHWGGAESVDGLSVANSSTYEQTIGGTLAYMVTPAWQLLLQYRGDVVNQNGILTDVFQARICYITDIDKLFH